MEKKGVEKTNKKSQDKEIARLLFLQGESQKLISERLNVSRVTINRWVNDGNWETLKAAKTITRRELINKMLQKVNDLLNSEKFVADELVKAASAIEKLDKQTNIVTYVEVFTIYNNWLVSRMAIDKELTPELIKLMNKYQDIFIGECLSTTQIEITSI